MRRPAQQLRSRNRQRGYVLLVLLLMIAVLTIGFLEATKYDLQYTVQQIKRDHEEELIHRGVQYSRAVRRYFKKFGRYPTRIEDLENTDNIRFLRKRYKDPITGKDFKLLHMNDVQFGLNVQLAPNPVHTAPPEPTEKGSPDEQSAGSDENGQDSTANASSDDPQPDASQSEDQGQQIQISSSIPPAGTTNPALSAPQAGAANPPQVFGGAPIVGVVSLSKAKSLREFNRRDHYDQWQFIYDPSTDSGGLLITPNQPPLQAQKTQN